MASQRQIEANQKKCPEEHRPENGQGQGQDPAQCAEAWAGGPRRSCPSCPTKIRGPSPSGSRAGPTTGSRKTDRRPTWSAMRRDCRGRSTGPSGSRRPTSSHRVRKAQRRAAGAPDPRRLEEVADLGCKLLGDQWEGSRAVLVARLEATAEGCRWLLDQWGELQTLQSSGAPGEEADLHRFIHLLGKQRFEAVTDPALNALLVAWDVLKPGIAQEFWKWTCAGGRAGRSQLCADRQGWRELGPRPANPAEATDVIAEMRDQQIDRLTRLLAGHAQCAAEEAVDLPDRAAFDPGAGFERHRRYRTALGREMLRTLDTLRKLRKDGYEMADAV